MEDPIWQEVDAIPDVMLYHAVLCIKPRLHLELECGGGHIKPLHL